MTDVKDVLGRHVPLRAELEPEWGDVLERAGRRKRRRLLPALAAAGGLAAAALVAVALWPSGGRPLTVLDRARAAVGDGPVTHLVYRDELGETLVNLASGERRPIYGDHEEWFDASRGLRDVYRFNGRVQEDVVYSPDRLPPQAKGMYAVFADYREALRDGTATLRGGQDAIGGRAVYWIHLKGEQLFDVGDGKFHEWTHEVAIDAETYRPVYVRETRDGVPGPGTGQAILSIETLPAGAGDFSSRNEPSSSGAFLDGTSGRTDVTGDPGAASRALDAPALWLGQSYRGLPLARAEVQQLKWGRAGSPRTGVGVELCYGGCDQVVLQEATERNDVYGWDRGGAIRIRAGWLLLGWGSHNGFLIREGVYVRIGARSEEEVLAAARALEPVS